MILFASADRLEMNKDVLIDPIAKTADQNDIYKQVNINSKKNKFTNKISGNFVSLLLSSAKSPYRNSLVIFTKMYDTCYLSFADDLRQNKDNSLIGLAMMFSLHSKTNV